jgi:hypothetical protein
MALDEQLVDRVRALLAGRPGIAERRRFGCQAFLVNDNFACGAFSDRLIVRMSVEDYPAALQEPGVSEFDMTGKPSRGWVLVDQSVLQQDDELKRWVDIGTQFATALPRK